MLVRALLLLLLPAFAHAASIVQVKTITCNGTCTSPITLSFTTSQPVVGDTVAVAVSGNQFNAATRVTPSDNQTNVYAKAIQYQTVSGNQASFATIWKAPIATSSGTFTVSVPFVSGTAVKLGITLYEISAGNNIDATGAAFDGGITGQSSVTVANLHSNAGASDVVITAAYGCGSTSQQPVTPVGYTADTTGACVASAHNVDSSVGTDSATWTFGTATPTSTEVIASFGGTAANAPNLVDVTPLAWNAAGGTTQTVTVNSVNAGDTLIAAVGDSGSAAPTVSDGTSYTQDAWAQQSTVSGAGVFSLWNAGAGTHNVVLTLSATQTPVFTVMEVSGLGTSNSLDVTATAQANSVGPLTASTAALSNANDFSVISAEADSFQAMTSPAAWTAFQIGSGSSGSTQQSPSPCIAALIPGATTALSPSCGLISAASWAVAIAAYHPPGGSACGAVGWNMATRTFTVPTAGTGSFWLSTASAGSVNCTGNGYWSTSRTFVVN